MSDTPEPFFHRYTRLATEADLVAAMREQLDTIADLAKRITPERARQIDPPYTWTPLDVLNHILDAERVFGYRALRFARGDAQPLPGFDENNYAVNADATRTRHIDELVEEHALLRQSHIAFFRTLPADAWHRKGVASGMTWSVLDLARVIVGHARHHLNILEMRLRV